MKLAQRLKIAQSNKECILATNFYNFETLRGVLEAVKMKNQPIILQLTKSSIAYMGLENAVSMAKTGIEYYGVQGWVHLDHGGSVELAHQCLKAGFDSVMYDGSELPIEENIHNTKKVVALANNFGANVEAELGYIAKLGQSDKIEYTAVKDAKEFVDATKVNALAVAIGTAHGFYKQTPKLNFERLVEITEATDVPLVLHGGSGVPGDAIIKAVGLGICKLNVATELKNAFMLKLQALLIENTEIDLRKVFPPAIDAVKAIVESKLDLVARQIEV